MQREELLQIEKRLKSNYIFRKTLLTNEKYGKCEDCICLSTTFNNCKNPFCLKKICTFCLTQFKSFCRNCYWSNTNDFENEFIIKHTIQKN